MKAWARCSEPTLTRCIECSSPSAHTPQLCGRSVMIHQERDKKPAKCCLHTGEFSISVQAENGKQLCFILTEAQPCKTSVKEYFPKRVKLWWCAWSPTLCTKAYDRALNICGIKKDSLKNCKVLKGWTPAPENPARVSLNSKLWLPPGHCSCSMCRHQYAWRGAITAGAIGLVVERGKCCVYMLEGREVSANTQVILSGSSWCSLI